MKMNGHLHFVVDKKLHEKISKEAFEKGMNISELCRKKLLEEDRLERIEKLLNELIDKMESQESSRKNLRAKFV